MLKSMVVFFSGGLFAVGVILMCFKVSHNDKYPMLYSQLSTDSLLAFTRELNDMNVQVIGVLHGRNFPGDEYQLLTLLPNKEWLEIDIDRIPFAYVDLRSTLIDEIPVVYDSCLEEFVIVSGRARQHGGVMSIFDITGIDLLDSSSDLGCLVNSPWRHEESERSSF